VAASVRRRPGSAGQDVPVQIGISEPESPEGVRLPDARAVVNTVRAKLFEEVSPVSR